MPITLDLPADVEKRLRDAAAAHGMDFSAFAVATLSQAADNRDKASDGEVVLPAFSANSSKQAYVAEATRLASARGLDPELAAGLASGIADSETGQTYSLDETRAHIDAALKSGAGKTLV